MSLCAGLDRPKSRKYNIFWKSVFVLVVLAVIIFVYLASKSVDYIWRWYRIPQYFFYEEQVDVRAEIQGEVVEIERGEEETLIRIKGGDQSEEYSFPGENVLIYAGDFVYAGDILGKYKEWQAGILLQGLWLTLKVSIIGIVLGIILGVLTGLARISENPALRWGAITYIEVIRGSPLLVQIFLWYFVAGTLINAFLADFSLPRVPALWFGIIALAIFAGAYVAEIVRAGIQSIPRGQMEASRSLGLTYAQSMRKVILPQATKRILPPMAGQFISLIKDSSLLGVISIRELTKATREVVTSSLQPFELWIVCALLYLILTFTLSMFVQYLERRAV
jgi:polar amino acid transport system permease protein